MVVIIKCHGLAICFPGDMEVAGWKGLLKDKTFVQAISEVNVFVASHHGRENGCCEELFSQTGLKPQVVLISDSGVEHATQQTVSWYGARAGGMNYKGQTRRVFTTRSDGRILIEASPSGTTLDIGVS